MQVGADVCCAVGPVLGFEVRDDQLVRVVVGERGFAGGFAGRHLVLSGNRQREKKIEAGVGAQTNDGVM